MKIAVPTANGKLCMHFGHCEVFTFVEIDETTKQVLNTEELTPPPHEPGVLPPWVAEQGAKLVIAGGMGGRAVQLFNNAGVKVLTGAPVKTPQELALGYVNNELTFGANACDH